MPFGDVYTSLQTGVVDVAENGINIHLSTKHYEVAPIMSLSEHEANNSLLWVSENVRNAMTAQQKQWVRAADEVGRTLAAAGHRARSHVAEEARENLIAFCILFPDVVLWLTKHVRPEPSAAFARPAAAAISVPADLLRRAVRADRTNVSLHEAYMPAHRGPTGP